MKLSNLSVMFIIIIIPIILVFSYYVSLQLNTINMQTSYNSKLLEATKTAIEAFEINTVEWNGDYSSVANSKRRDVMASINTFTTSFANNLGIGGANKERILSYIPAIAVTLYDGYYIYSPAETKQIVKNENGLGVSMTKNLTKNMTEAKISGYTWDDKDEGKILYLADDGKNEGTYSYTKSDGTTVTQLFTLDSNNAKTDYSHILKPFTSYSARYVSDDKDTDIVVNYTLDNYITIYGTVNGTYQIRSGYLIDTNATPPSEGGETLNETISYTYNGTSYIKNNCTYIYASDNTKVYFDGDTLFQVSTTGERINLEDKSTMYKKIVLDNGEPIYKPLNTGKGTVDTSRFYSDTKGTEYTGTTIPDELKKDISARNYYYEAKNFSEWVYEELDDITIGNMQVNEKELERIYGNPVNKEELYGGSTEKLFDTNPESDTSIFAEHKRNVIKQALITNLNQAITSYSRRNSEGDYQLPVLSETDWDQILRNVSMITFVQNLPIGMKYYNNYVVATSTINKEYVNPDEIYLNGSDGYYHMPYCKKLTGTSLIGYRNTDYVIKSYTEGEETKYYYKHNIDASTTRQACYYCIVQRDLFEGYKEDSDEGKAHNRAYQTALSRERYITHEFR